jgi:hypothetical protein
MKRLSILLLFISVSAFAQFDADKLSFGLRLGPSATWITDDDQDDGSSTFGKTVTTSTTSKRYGVYGGGFAHYALNDKFAVRAELMLSFNGSRNTSSSVNPLYSSTTVSKLNINYIQVPVLLMYDFGKRGRTSPYIVSGLAPALMVSNSFTSTSTLIDKTDKETETDVSSSKGGIKKFDVGFVIGFGIKEFKAAKRLGAEMRWNLGLTPIAKVAGSYPNGSFSITAHYLIGGLLTTSTPAPAYQRYKRVGGKQ